MRLPLTRRAALFLNWIAALVALSMIWLPEFRAHWASPLLVSTDAVTRARTEPAEALLNKIAGQTLGLPLLSPDPIDGRRPSISMIADRLLTGEIQFPKMPATSLAVPFDVRNLTVGPPTLQLYIASLASADVFIKAYRESGDERYLQAAGREVSAFSRVDRWRLLPVGMLWNDHALAAAIPVLADYWSAVRKRDDLDSDHAREVLSLVSRSAARLARAENYTFRTNHGLMQSIALLQVAAAFPTLERSRQLRALACARIAEQAGYYLSPEGPVLEHSAGYHMLGLYLFNLLGELGPEHGCAQTQAVAQRLDRARAFASLLRRPDGSLPALGNTDHAETYDTALIGSPSPVSASGLYPASGFAIRWHGHEKWPATSSLAQTVMTWSNFPSRAHKLADDLSVLVWAGGENWLVNTGYWPYGIRGEESARGWAGSNAPNLQGESPDAPRRSILRGYAETDRVWSTDVERISEATGIAVRRQVVAVDGRTWLIVDSSHAEANGTLNTAWTFPPDKLISSLSAEDFLIQSPMTENAARMTILPTQGLQISRLRGRLDPFGGWVVRDGTPVATDSLILQREPARKFTMTVMLTGDRRELASLPTPTLRADSTAEDWEVELGSGWGGAHVRSVDGEVRVDFADGSVQRLTLAADFSEADSTRASIIESYEQAAARTDRIPYLLPYRYRLTWVFLALLLAQEIVIFAARRVMPRATPAIRVAASISWLIVGLLAAHWYLVK